MTKIAEENVTDPARVQDCLSNILSTSDFLLDMSKLEAGEAETEHEPFDLRDVLQSAGTIISAQVADCGIAFTADTPEGTHWRLRGSPLNIQRVLQNIMSNAVKYNRPGGSVHVSAARPRAKTARRPSSSPVPAAASASLSRRRPSNCSAAISRSSAARARARPSPSHFC